MPKCQLQWIQVAVITFTLLIPKTTGQLRPNRNVTKIPQTIVDDNQRLVNWCVSGVDEPEFNFYPLNEFVPYLQKTDRTLIRRRDKFNKPRYDYTIDLVDVRFRDGIFGVRGALLNTAHLKFKSLILREHALGIREVLQNKSIEGLVIQVNHAPLGIGMPTGRFVFPEEEIVCFDCIKPQGIPIGCRKRTADEIVHPTIMAYHHRMQRSAAELVRLQNFTDYRNRPRPGSNSNLTEDITTASLSCIAVLGPKNCDPNNRVIGESSEYGSGNEIHGTFAWYYPPCTVTRVIEFIVLVVHSFNEQDYEVLFFGPYDLPDISGSRDQSKLVPTPFFYGFRENIICDTEQENTLILSESDRTSRVTYPFDYSYNYDVCLRNSQKENGLTCPIPPASRCMNNEDKDFKLRADPCELLCSPELSTTLVAVNENQFFKRTPHGGINMITNFCLQPICIFIGRYYKETFNRNAFKGVKLWYWIHFLGGGIASICQYFGYFHPVWVQRTNPHFIAGNFMMIMLGITYASSWIRHKNHWATSAAEFFHGAAGYCVSGLAFWCLHTAPGVSDTALILVYAATGLLAFGYIIMECCICLLDRKFGMKPRRRHFPTVEARFYDLPVPQRPARIAFLIVLTVLMFILTALTIIV